MDKIVYGMRDAINSLLNYFDKFNKLAYPNDNTYSYNPKTYDLQKWLQSVKDIAYEETLGISRRDAIKRVTASWHEVETFDFLNWLKFYQEGAQLKYKTAQNWYENGQPGYFLHLKEEPRKQEFSMDNNAVQEAAIDPIKNLEKKRLIEFQRNKIIGRLDSAEKLLRTPEGQLLAGNDLEQLMEAIYSLKKKVQLVNKISTSTRLYDDMIVREGNVLKRKGFVKAASVMYSMAQDQAPVPDLSATPPDAPTVSDGAPGGLPATIPGVPNAQTSSFNDQNANQPSPQALQAKPNTETLATTPPVIPQAAPKAKGIEEFLIQMNTGGDTDQKTLEDDNDILEVEDDQLMVTEAQAAPAPPSTPTAPAPVATEEPLEVSEKPATDSPQAEKTEEQANLVDQKIDEALANITIQDVIAKLEDLSKVFKIREIPRQLSLIDLMLQNLSIASYFANLSEAQNKALDSNNYISTRIDDILSKLRGAAEGHEIDLKGDEQEIDPKMQAVKNQLQSDEDKDKARKENRKKQDNAEEDNVAGKETPNVEMENGLAGQPAAPPVPAPPKV